MLLSIGSCVLDTAAFELRRDGKPVAVEPKVFDFLTMLARNPGQLISRNEMIDALWAGRIVSEASLSSCVKAARRAVGDDGKVQNVIRTVHGRGFKLVPTAAESLRVGAGPESAAVPAGEPLTLPKEPSIAVLPLDVMSSAQGSDIVASGFVQDIITGLGRSRRLLVIARGTVFALSRQASDPREVARTLGVRYVLSGCLRYDGSRLRLSVALTDAPEPFEIWAESFDRNVDDIFALQDEISDLVINRVQATIETSERRRALLRPVASLDAWAAYYRARWHLDRHTADDYDQAESLLKQAEKLDPDAARIHAGLSFVHRQRAFLNLRADREGEIRRAIDRAKHSLSLEPEDPQARWAYGRALMLRNDVGSALHEFEAATSLNPSFAIGQYSVGFARSMIGATAPSDEALGKARRLSPLDPMRFAMLATHAFNCAATGQHERAVELAGLAAAHPNAHFHIVAIAALCGAIAGKKPVADKYARLLRQAKPDYGAAEFFSAFPFQSADYVATFRRGFKLLGLPA